MAHMIGLVSQATLRLESWLEILAVTLDKQTTPIIRRLDGTFLSSRTHQYRELQLESSILS